MENGNTINFWRDCYYGNRPPRVKFPSLYRITLISSTRVNNVLDIYNGSLNWNIIFERSLQDWEVDDYALLLSSLYEECIKIGEDDCSK